MVREKFWSFLKQYFCKGSSIKYICSDFVTSDSLSPPHLRAQMLLACTHSLLVQVYSYYFFKKI